MKLDLLTSPELVIFTTRDLARLAGISLAAASKRLARLSTGNASLVQLTRGVWANKAHPHFNVLACVPVLLGSEQGGSPRSISLSHLRPSPAFSPEGRVGRHS